MKRILAAVLFFGIFSIIIQSNLVYAISATKIPLIQQSEQFPGQEVTGFCTLETDEGGNLHWRIKVNGLVSGTQGSFKLGHLTGEVEVPFNSEDGTADSGNKIIHSKNDPLSFFSKFAKCKVNVYTSNFFDNQLIALGDPGISNQDTEENNLVTLNNEIPKKNPSIVAFGIPGSGDSDKSKKPNASGDKFYLFSTLEYVIGLITNHDIDFAENKKINPVENASPFHSTENTSDLNVFSPLNSIFGPPPPPDFLQPNNTAENSNEVDEPSSISITSPTDNSIVSEISIITVEVKNFPNAIVNFYVDDSPIGSDFKEPYEMILHTKDLSSGKHSIKAELSSTETNSTINIFKIDKSNSDKSNSDKSNSDKSNSDKSNSDKSNSDKSNSDKSNSDKSNSDKSNSDKSNSDKSNSDKSNSDKSNSDKSNSDKSNSSKK